MSAVAEKTVSLFEADLKNPTLKVVDALKEETKKSLGNINANSTQVEIQIYATVKSEDVLGVVPVVKWTAAELYGDSVPTFLAFKEKTQIISKALIKLISCDESDVDFELESVQVWTLIANLQRCFGASSQHDELISTLTQLVQAEKNNPLTKSKAYVLEEAFEMLNASYNINEQILDKVYDILDEGGFDLDYSMSFANSEN